MKRFERLKLITYTWWRESDDPEDGVEYTGRWEVTNQGAP